MAKMVNFRLCVFYHNKERKEKEKNLIIEWVAVEEWGNKMDSGNSQRHGNLMVGRADIWRRPWHPTPVLWPGRSHGRRSLVDCSPWGHEELDTAEQLHFHFSLLCIGEGNGNPLAWRIPGTAVYGVTQSQTRLKWLSSSSSSSNWYFTTRLFKSGSYIVLI